MDATNIIITIFSLVVVFLFAIQKFGRQIRKVAGERFKTFINKWTDRPAKGLLVGAFITSIIQSSTATSVILVSFVNAGLLNVNNALSVILGANIGTTITAQLVALKMTYIAPIIVIAGFIITHTRSRLRKFGKAIFYFGVVFLSLFIISILITPLKDNPSVITILRSTDNLYSAVVVGTIVTMILQSSSVFTGLVIILAANGLVGLEAAVGFMLGSNIGTPITAIIASTTASIDSKKVAVSHMFFNVSGVAVFFLLKDPFLAILRFISDDLVQEIVNAHFLFNASWAIVCLVGFKWFVKATNKITFAIYKK